MNRCFSLVALFALHSNVLVAAEKVEFGETEAIAFFESPGRILFLGDSITNSGYYITFLETHFQQGRRAVEGLEWINLGLPSETCTGLSEPSHPFPRPDVHERLDRALEKVKPDVVVACYGMNDGIYHPFDEERFQAYQKGMKTLVEKAKATGAYTIVLTPPPFDPLPLRERGKLVGKDAKEFAWHTIYEDYADVIQRYAEWILTKEHGADMVIDVHTPINEALSERRKSDPHYAMSTDGVHMDESGHRVMADAILEAWGKKPTALNEGVLAQLAQRQSMMHAAWVSHVGHKRPGVKPGLPLAEAQDKGKAMGAVLQTLIVNSPQAVRFEELEKVIAELRKDVDAAKRRYGDYEVKFLFPSGESPLSLQQGQDLSAWNGDSKFWSVNSQGVIRGANEGVVPSSTYLFSKKAYREFRLIFEVKQTVGEGYSTMHSAVAVLGEQFEDKGPNPYGFKGPLLMFCHDWGIWDAYRRNRVEPAGQRGTLNIGFEKIGDWNLVEFLVVGNRIQCAANGNPVFDFTDKPEMLQASPIGLQLHSNQKPQEFQFRHLYVSENPMDELVTVGTRDAGEAP